jgi:hypothetical protein
MHMVMQLSLKHSIHNQLNAEEEEEEDVIRK